MSNTNIAEQIEYPESDGQPMGETDLHRKWMMHILNLLDYRYRDEFVYVASNLLVYYEEGQPTRVIVPDDFVVLDCHPGERRTFQTWVEKRVPDVVFEVSSRWTCRDDLVHKPQVYEQMGVREYFLYDPEGLYLHPPLQGFRLNSKGILVQIDTLQGELVSETLRLRLRLNAGELELVDRDTGEMLLTEAQANFCQAQQEKRQAEKERRRAEDEYTARINAEARVRELEAELARLRHDQGLS